MKKRVNYSLLLLFLSFFIVFFVASLSSQFTSQGVESQWYQDNRPSLTPPGWVFSVVWGILYILLAVSLWLAFCETSGKQRVLVLSLYGGNLVFNLLWTLFYFRLHLPLLAFVDLLLIFSTALALILILFNHHKRASLLLVPYVLWVAFAGLLNILSL